MTKEINGKVVRIPDAEIDNFVENLNLSIEEAVQMWLDDNGYTVNEEQEALNAKAKAQGRLKENAKSTKERKKTERKRKVDEVKHKFLEKLLTFLLDADGVEGAVLPKGELEEKYLNFKLYGEDYTLSITKHRVKEEK